MTEESHLLDKKEKNWLSRILKLTFFICAFILVGITVLSNMGGSNDSLKESVERFASNVFGGRKTSVSKLVYMGFFPRIGFDAEGINVMSTPEDGHIIAHIGKIQAFMPFWNVVTQTPEITSFYLEDFTTVKGALASKELHIEKMFIDHDLGTQTAKLRGNGKIGVHHWSFAADMEIFGKKGNYTFSFEKSFPLVFDIADIHFEGKIVKHDSSYYKLEDFKLSSGDNALEGNIIFSLIGEELLKVKGDVAVSGGKSIVSPDVIFDYSNSPAKISGKVMSDHIVYSDLNDEGSAFHILKRLYDIVGYGDVPKGKASFLGNYNLDVILEFKSIRFPDILLNNLTFPILQSNAGIKFGPIHGDLGIMPSLVFVSDQDTGDIISILQDGQLYTKFFKKWLKNVPNKIGTIINVDCGLARFSHSDGDLDIKRFVLNTNRGSIKVRENKIGADQNVDDLTFYISSKEEEHSEISLNKDAYEFVQSSFQSSSKVSLCSSYISKKLSDSDENTTIDGVTE
ncbi:MAG: hypothetical protein ACRBB3_01300 [Alphaproteobacteria bacterium]